MYSQFFELQTNNLMPIFCGKINGGIIVSTNFAVRLQQQMHGSAFAYLNQELGIDLVSTIPTVDLSSLKGREGDYPAPWDEPEQLPADIVKAVLPSGRPLIAVRYVQQEEGKDRLILEIFFQRYSSQMLPQITGHNLTDISAGTSIDFAQRVSSEYQSISKPEMDSNWERKNFCNDSIFNPYNPSATFQMIRNLANGESLDKTDGRYLPMYADLYAIKV